MLYGDLGIDLALQHLQTEFLKIEIARKSKLLYGDLGNNLSVVNLAAPRSVPTQQTVYVVTVAPTLQFLTISLARPSKLNFENSF